MCYSPKCSFFSFFWLPFLLSGLIFSLGIAWSFSVRVLSMGWACSHMGNMTMISVGVLKAWFTSYMLSDLENPLLKPEVKHYFLHFWSHVAKIQHSFSATDTISSSTLYLACGCQPATLLYGINVIYLRTKQNTPSAHNPFQLLAYLSAFSQLNFL